MDDHELWERLRSADQAAFGDLFRRHADAIYNVAFRRTASWELAEDVVQSTFTALWRRARSGHIDALRSDSAVAVLIVMSTHEARNLVRARTRRLKLAQRLSADETRTPDPAEDVVQSVDDERRMARVVRVMDRLPERQRQVIELVAWSGCTAAEAASALGVSEGTVKSRLSRGRAHLRALMESAEGLDTP